MTVEPARTFPFGDLYTVVVTGATGKTGRLVAAGAAALGWRVRAAGRRAPVGGPAGAGPPVEWLRMEWDEPESWEPAFAGSDAAYVVVPFDHPGAPERAPGLLRAAARAGVGRIVLLSSLDAAHADRADPLVVAEQALLELPVRRAILRPTWFLDNFTAGSFAGMTAAGELRLPAGDGRIPFVDVRDVAEVAVAALAPGGPQGILPLTGPEQLHHRHVAEALTAALGRPIRYTPVGAPEFVHLMERRGFSRDYASFLAGALQAVASGRLRVPTTGTVERVLGRRARDVDAFAAACRSGARRALPG